MNIMEHNLAPSYAPMSKEERDLLEIDLTDRSAPHLIAAACEPGAAPQWMAANRGQVLDMVGAKGWALVRATSANASRNSACRWSTNMATCR